MPELQILHEGKPTSSLDIANFEDGSLSPAKTIGVTKDGKKYLYDKSEEAITKKIRAWQAEGKALKSETAMAMLKKDPPLKEFPKNYPNKYFASQSGLIFMVETLDLSKSKDKFVVQYQDKALVGKGTIQVVVEIKNPKNSKSLYKEKVKITLVEDKQNPGTFRSQDLVLVSAKYIDEYRVNGKKDNSPQDQTFLAELGSEISISYRDEISRETHIISASIPVKKVLETPIFVFKDANGVPLANQEQINKHLADAQEVWAPAGVKIKGQSPIYLDLPSGIDLSDGLDPKEAEVCIKHLNEKYPNNPGVRFIFAGDKFPGSETTGAYSITQKDPYSVMHGLQNNIFLKSEWMLAETTGHEIAHCLLDSVKKGTWESKEYDPEGHAYNPSNIMAHDTLFDTKHMTVFGRRNLSDDQINMALKSSRLKDPSQEDLGINLERNNPVSQPRSIFDAPREVQAAHREGWRIVPQP